MANKAIQDIQPELPEATPLDFVKLLRIHKTIRIAVSGDVFLTELETKIIDTSDFQRLRGIRQLGSVNLVFPTALHTRFDHCLGTLKMVEDMMRHVEGNSHNRGEERQIEPIQKVLGRLYALLHDVPHVSFGHTIEDELNIFDRHDKNSARLDHFFDENSQIGTLITAYLGPNGLKRFRSIYEWDGTEKPHEAKSLQVLDDAFIYDLVSNTICADLLDYLARDFHFCNLGVPMEYRFLNFLYIGRDDAKLKRIFVRLWKDGKPEPRRDTLTDLTRLLEERYMVAERAYFHHAKIVAGTMIGRAILEAKVAGTIKEPDFYLHSDDSLLYFLANDTENPPVTRELARKYLDRKLHKVCFDYTKDDFAGLQQHNRDRDPQTDALNKVKDANARRMLENRLAEELGVSHGDIVIYAPSRKMNRKEAGMKILWNGKPSVLKDIDFHPISDRLSQILKAHEGLWGIRIITRPGLTDEQLELLRIACDIEFVTPEKELEQRRKRYYERITEVRLSVLNVPMPKDSSEYVKRKAEVANAMTVAANDNRPFNERLDDAIKLHFGEI